MSFIDFSINGGIVELTLSRPETRNAFGHADADEFVAVLDRVSRDRSAKVVILTGSGSAFSAGGDLQAMAKVLEQKPSPAETRLDYRAGVQRIPAAFHALEIPVIGAINGPAMGIGCDLACMCDIRIASSAAKFAQSFIKVGLISGDGGVWFLQRVLGWQRAAEMVFTGEPIDARKALDWGLVTDVVEPEGLMTAARGLAARIAVNPASTLRMSKRLMREAQGATLDSLLQLSASLQALAQDSPAHAEAVRAFLQRSSKKT
jgi:enoyl-CoA hydratase/carnithine racemase